MSCSSVLFFFFFKQKTAYEMRISDWSSDVCSSDLPGFSGALGTTLGAAGVNIATFHLGRAAQGQDAIALLELDAPIDAETLEKVRALPHTKQAEALRF